MVNSNYIWQVASMEVVDSDNDKLHPVLLQLLKKRGIVSTEQIHRFIYPNIDLLYNPMLLKDMDKAVIRIREALAKREKITVYGDYDVDGITSCCILVKLLRSLGGIVDYYIPSRLHEGYGLNKEAIEMIHKQGTSLVITVDNGMGSCEEVEYARSLGLDMVITDHHEPQETIPRATAVINPKQNSCNYPFKELAGVGVAFKLTQALLGSDSELQKDFLELTALGTVADIVPLLDENRIIVKNGLRILGNTKNKGLMAMMTLLNLYGSSIDTWNISYMLAPRINAAGRIADPSIAVELLLCEDEAHAFELASTLEKINRERQSLEAKLFEEAKTAIDNEVNLDTESIIVISNPDWHPGIIGTVASKLTERYGRPCIMIAEEGNEGRGSGRSVDGFNLFNAINKLSHRLIRYGGHEQAVGLSIKVDDIDQFKTELNKLFKDEFKQIDWKPKLDIDLELDPRDIDLELAKQLELMEPYGCGNPKPVFMCKSFYIGNMRTVGNNDKHLKLSLTNHKNNIDAIGFNFGMYKEDLAMASIMDLAFYLEVNRWGGFTRPQLNIKDIKVPFLRDELLEEIEEKYYRSFLSKIGKKQLPPSKKEILFKKNVITFNNKNISEKKRYVKALFQKPEEEVVVLINTPYKAWQLLSFLQLDTDLKGKPKVCYGLDYLRKDYNDNIIVIGPFIEFNKQEFNNIVFYDTPFCLEFFGEQINGISQASKIHILFDREDLRYNYLTCQQVLPSINELKAAYQILGRLTSGRFVGCLNINEFKSILQEHLGTDINYSSLISVFKVFEESGIIEYEIKNRDLYIVNYNKPDGPIRLEYSDTYMYLFMLKKKVIEFYDQYCITKKLFKSLGGN